MKSNMKSSGGTWAPLHYDPLLIRGIRDVRRIFSSTLTRKFVRDGSGTRYRALWAVTTLAGFTPARFPAHCPSEVFYKLNTRLGGSPPLG